MNPLHAQARKSMKSPTRAPGLPPTATPMTCLLCLPRQTLTTLAISAVAPLQQRQNTQPVSPASSPAAPLASRTHRFTGHWQLRHQSKLAVLLIACMGWSQGGAAVPRVPPGGHGLKQRLKWRRRLTRLGLLSPPLPPGVPDSEATASIRRRRPRRRAAATPLGWVRSPRVA